MGSDQVDIKYHITRAKPTPFDNKLQLIIYSSSTKNLYGLVETFMVYNFHDEPMCACDCSIFCCYFSLSVCCCCEYSSAHFYMILRADMSTVIYDRDKLETNEKKILLKKR